MKQLATIFCAILIIYNVQAQSAKKIQLQNRHMSFVNSLLQQQNIPAGAARSTGVTGQRVIAQSTRDNTLATLNDSLDLKYGPNRGSTYDYNTMIFPYNYPYSTNPMFNFAGTFAKPQVLFDTLLGWRVDLNTLLYGYF